MSYQLAEKAIKMPTMIRAPSTIFVAVGHVEYGEKL
jgi:hypothetical protein